MARAIHQFVAGFSNGDAISNEARVLRDLFRSWGHESEIYCEGRRILPELRSGTRDLSTAASTIAPEDIVVHHLSIGSPANEVFARLNCRKAIIYHNITPPDFFRGLQEEIAHSLRTGIEQAKMLAGKADVVLADSTYNAEGLLEMGHTGVRVQPLFLNRKGWDTPPSKRILSLYKDGKLNVLFVGRCAPSKRIEDLLATFYYIQNYVDTDARFIHVGSPAGLERYQALLRAKVAEWRLRNVVFAGSVRQDELNAYYACADAFLCMSDHEGFCIPLLEAMAHHTPVIAYAAGAVEETMDGAGVLHRQKDYALAAETVGRVARDAALRKAIIAGQDARLQRYLNRDLHAEMKANLASLL